MSCDAILVGDGSPRHFGAEESRVYAGPGFVWLHVEGGREDSDLAALRGADMPDLAASALVATETRPRCERFEDGALINGRESRLCFMGHVLMENRNGLAVDATLTHATGAAGREAALAMPDRRRRGRTTPCADKPVLSARLAGSRRGL